MNAETDDSVLSAYLDGELDVSRRLQVESALLSSPRLAARLRELSRSREALRLLPRPATPRDLTDDVLAGIGAIDAERARRRRLTRQTLPWALAGVPAAAAALLLAWTVGRSGNTQVAPSGETPHGNAPMAIRLPEESPAAVVAEQPAPATPTNPPDAPAAMEVFESPERLRLRTLLGQGEVRRLVVAVPALDAAGLRPVKAAIDRTHRAQAELARVELEPGGADPAVVFALVLDSVELDGLRSQLAAELDRPKDALVDEPASAPLVMAVASAPQFAIETGQAAATAIAQTLPVPDPLQARQLPVANVRPGDRPAPTPVGAAPVETTQPNQNQRSVYLIWIEPATERPDP